MSTQEEGTEYQGYWWLPQFPDHKVAGTLTGIKTGDLKLSLLGKLQETSIDFGIKSVTYPTILGIVHGKLVSLGSCYVIGSRVSFPGFKTEILSVHIAFIGEHILNPEEAKLSKIILKFDYFDEWLCIPSIKTEHVVDDESGELLGYDFSYRTPKPINVDFEEFNISIFYGHNMMRTFPRNIELKQYGTISLHSHEGMTLREWNHKFIYPWQNFMTLATGELCHLQTLGILKENEIIDVFFAKTKGDTSKNIKFFDMFFTMRDVKDKFCDFLKNWLSISSQFDSVCNLFFSTKYTSSLYVEDQFLPIVQALESYHRRSEKFNHKKKFVLKERLHDIFDFVTEVVNPLVEDRNEFIKTVVNTRNHNTHFNNKPEDQFFRGRDLFWATRILGYMLQACLLREIGFSNEETGSLFRRNQEYMYAERYIQEHYFKKDKQVRVNHTPEDESDPLVGMFALSPTASINTEEFSAEELLKLEGKL
ncbi:hypothetical protein Syn7502_02233 [Synechococcus sp. PCC 7502]|uniref:ApeA N-terminal domain 1-containing protein n=1 Tax=Synechococcus sp. PCC 7502 TaxID=1173263 RepID=UPI00029FBDD9|nr:HEPN domain-containing protein [Synechococcus sp. PCC 7502]AFY74241.1 hypothetical protein Syn7502_02233 [Synechococcus sp. PCC 7502]